MLFLWFSIISFIALSCSSSTVGHDNTFIPDYVLNITQINVPIGCKNRLSIVANGTVPGPPIVMKENQTTWVRVYNGMADQSLTTVSQRCCSKACQIFAYMNSTGMASAKVLRPLVTALPESVNGRYHHFISSTVGYLVQFKAFVALLAYERTLAKFPTT